MSEHVRDVTEIYRKADEASRRFTPGQQVDIPQLMRSAFMHGYAQALLDIEDKPQSETKACRIAEYDGAFRCTTHHRTWGRVTNPDQPCAGWKLSEKDA